MNSAPSLSVAPSISSDHQPRTLVMALKTFSGLCSTENVVVKSCEHVRLSFTRDDQLAQIAVDEHAPRVRAATVAFNLRGKTYMGQTDFRFAVFCEDIKDNVGTSPLAFVFQKAEAAVQDVPNNFLVRNQLCDLLFGTVHILIAVRKFGAELVGFAFDLS